MPTGTSACLYLRNIQRAVSSVRNVFRLGIVAQELGRSRLRQSSRRKIHTTCQAISPHPTSNLLGSRSGSRFIVINQSTFEDCRLANGGCYLMNHRCLRGLSTASRLGNLSSLDQPVHEKHISEHPPSAPAESNQETDSIPEEPTAESPIPLEDDHEYQEWTNLVRYGIMHVFTQNNTAAETGFGITYTSVLGLGVRKAKKMFHAKAWDSSKLMAKVKARRLIKLQLEKAGYWDRMQKLVYLHESNPESFDEALKAFNESLKPSPLAATLNIPDDLLFTFDKDARKDLEEANSLMKAELSKLNWQTSQRSQRGASESREFPDRRMSRESFMDKHLKNPEYNDIKSKTMQLPVRRYTTELLNLINNNTYSLCVAETGSGKSTQIPQLILEDAIFNGAAASCRILCVQPRRIAVTELARRVAKERLEPLGQSVGYAVRLDRRPATNEENIEYCTTGTLMNILKGGPDSLDRFSHIVLDEIHVRDVQIDFVMLVLKRAIEHRQINGKPVPKVVLMGATFDVDLFASYFGIKSPDGTVLPAPHIIIPGRTFEVKKHYLEQVLHKITHSIPPEILSRLLQDDRDSANFLNNHFKVFGNLEQNTGQPNLLAAMKLEENSVASGLISATIFSILSTAEQGSFLVFVPGKQQMEDVTSQLKTLGPRLGFDFEDSNRFKIIWLHSELSNSSHELSLPVPKGCQRIIIATDIAETSLTIPDVKHVVDSGKCNLSEVSFKDQVRVLAPHWISHSAALQRAGRVGRVQAGGYYFLGSFERFRTLRGMRSPEITRSNLEELCLHLRKAVPDPSISLSELFAQTLQPPGDDRVSAAVASLKELQALDDQEQLTSLGYILENLDMDPSFGKMVILGLVFRCLDPMVILASLGSGSHSHRFFKRDLDHNGRASLIKSRSKFDQGLNSDHMTKINAFRAVRVEMQKKKSNALVEYASSRESNSLSWDAVTRAGVREKAAPLVANFMSSHHIDPKVYRATEMTAQFIMKKLYTSGLHQVPPTTGAFSMYGSPQSNCNSENAHLVKALLVHCLSPNLAVKRIGHQNFEIKPGTFTRSAIKTLPRSEAAVFAYSHKFSNQNTWGIAEATQVRPLTACLLTNKLEIKEGNVFLDSWLGFKLENETCAKEQIFENLIQQRKLLNDALHTAFKILPFMNIPNRMERSQYMLARRRLFDTLAQTMEIIVAMDTPPKVPDMPSFWN